MKGKNCPNCGAPYDIKLNKCPYCDTSYFDMSAIDFIEGKPFFLKMKINGTVITQLVIPQLNSFSMSYNTTYACGAGGETLCAFYNDKEIITDISFRAVPMNNSKKEMIQIQVEV